MKYLLSLIFIVKVSIPMGGAITFKATKISVSHNNMYTCTKEDGKVVYVPVMFTVIEEK